MFDNRKVKQIRKMPDGDAIIVIWIQILCLAGEINSNGMIYFSEDIPYTDEMLATEFDRPINTIRMALNVFRNFKMIEMADDVLLVSNWEKYQNVDSLEKIREQNRIRKQKQRERQKLLLENTEDVSRDISRDSNKNVMQCHATDIDKELDKDIDINNNKDIGKMSDQLSLKCPDKTTPEVKKELCNIVTPALQAVTETDNKNIKDKPAKVKEIKHKYGEYKNVLLSDTELEKLKSEFPLDWSKRIETVSEYCASKGKSYSNYLATIRNWARNEKSKGGGNDGKYGSVKINIPKSKFDPGTRNLDEEIKSLGLI